MIKAFKERLKVSGKWFLPLYLLAFLPLLSCSESDEVDPEFENWQQRNDAYFEEQYQSHYANMMFQEPVSRTTYVFPGWGQPSSKSLEEVAHNKCILVDVVTKGLEIGGTPLYTDTVKVNYRGRLIPTTHYPEGYEFDRSYLTTYDPDVDVPYQTAVSNLVDGFSTALQHMHRGDLWHVIVPYDLGYGSSEKSEIPAYSTLVFDIELVDFWSKEEGVR